VYLATFGATAGTTYKYFPLADMQGAFYVPASGLQAHRIGLGAAALPVVRASFIRLPSGASGAADKLWFYDYATAAFIGKTPPEAGRSDWQCIVANPFNSNELMLWRWIGLDGGGYPTTHRLWYSADYGDTWTSVLQDIGMRSDQAPPLVEWSPTVSGNWILTQHLPWDGSTLPIAGHHRLIRGNRTTYSVVYDSRSADIDRFMAHYGGDEEVIIQGVSGTFPWLIGANVLQAAPGGSIAAAHIDRLPMTRKVAAMPVDGGTVSISADYHSAAYVPIASTAGRMMAVLATGTLIIGGRYDDVGGVLGVQEVADAWGAATIIPALSGEHTYHVRTDRQTKQAAACVLATMRTAVRSSAGAWAIVAAPTAATGLANWVEVINSEVGG
jgi:hypothetical protein